MLLLLILKVEEAVLVAGSNKKLVLVLNKIGKFINLCLHFVRCVILRPGSQGSGREVDEIS